MTSDERKRGYQVSMGPVLGEYFHALQNHFLYTYGLFEEFSELFGSHPGRLELMNRAAPYFFRDVHMTMLHDLLLRICRMTDPPKNGSKNNLSIQRLRSLVGVECRREIQSAVKRTQTESEFARKWRDKRIAHIDLEIALQSKGVPTLPIPDLERIRTAIDAIGETLNAVDNFYNATTYDLSVGKSHGAKRVLYLLREGLHREKEIRDEINSGKLPYSAGIREPI